MAVLFFWVSAVQDQEDAERESNSTSTASERGDLSDHDDDQSFQEAYRLRHQQQQQVHSHNGSRVQPIKPSKCLQNTLLSYRFLASKALP